MSGKVLLTSSRNQSTGISKLQKFIFAVLFFSAMTQVQAQNCSVNANVNQSVCANETLTLIGSKAGLFTGAGTTTWSQVSGPSAIIVSPNSLTTDVTGVVGGYTYTFRLSTTCLDGSLVYDDVVYAVLPIRNATAGPDQSSCPATPAGNLAGNEPGAGSTGAWSVVGANNGVTILNPTSATSAFNLTTGEGNTTLRWTITHTNGCFSYDDMVITNLGGQLPVNAGPDQVLGNCYSTTQSTTLSGSFGGNGTGGQGGIWTVVSGPSVPNIGSPTSRITGVSGLEEGVYVFRWSVSGPCATGSDEVQVTVPAPTSDVTYATVFGGSQIWCDGRTSTVFSGTPPYYTNETVLWQQTNGPGGVTIESPNNPVTNITGLDGSSTYTFRYTIVNNVTACSSSETVTVSFATAPFINIVPDQLFASCGSGSISIPYTAGGTGVTQWSIISGPSTPAYPVLPTGYFNAGGSPLLVTGLSVPGTYVISIRRYSNIGISCETAFDNVSVIVSHPPTQSNAGTRQVLACNIFQTELTGNVPLVGTGSWSQVFGPGVATIVSPNTNVTAVTNLVNGLYRFRWIISGGPSCPANQNTVTVLVASIIPTQATAGPDQNVCIGTPIFLSGNYPVLNEWGEWSVTPNTPGLTFSNINSPVSMVTGQQANTIYTFTWTIHNACGITTDDCLINTSNTVGPVISEAGSDQCHGAGTTSVTMDGNDPAPGTGLWTRLTGPPATITDPTLYNTTVTGLTDGNYTFEWAISSGGCLPTRDTVMVTISAPATTSNAGADIELCGTSTALSGNTPVIGTGLWTQEGGPGGAIISDPLSPTSGITGLSDGVFTFYWTISNYACPSSVDSVSVFVSSPGSAAVAGPDQGLCAQTSVTMAATPPATGTGVWTIVIGPNSPNIVSPTSPTTVINNLVTGIYTFRWTVSGGTYCPSTSDDVNVEVTLAADAGSDQSYCEATTAVNLTGTVSTTGNWTQDSGPNTATITTTSANTAVASGLIPGVYVFRFTISTPGCTSSDVMTVTLYPPASTADAGPDQDLCDETSITLAGNTPAFGTGLWTKLAGPGSGSFLPNANTPNATYTIAEPGVYVFVWTISNGSCSNGDQVRIENSASPTTAVAGPDQTTVCSDEATMAANLPAIGVGNWTQISGPNSANIQSIILPNTVIDGMIPGTYTFRWTITNGTICPPSIDEVEITALLTPTPAEAGADQLLCNQNSTTMTATPLVVGTGAWSQISGPNSANFVNIADPATVVDNLITGTYVFEWTTTEGFCTSTDQVTVQNDALPTAADAGTDQDICLFSPLTLSGNTPVTGTGLWTQTAGPISVNILNPTSPTTSVIGALSGTYTFEWTISNGSCPSSIDAVDVIINDIPDQALAGPDQSLCNTNNTFLNGNNPTVGTGTWSQISGPNSATIVDPLDRQTQVTNLIAGTYEFEWEVANGACTSADYMLVVRHSDILVTGPSDASICNGGTQTLTVSASGGTGGYTYQWESSADGNIPWNTIAGATSSSYTTPALAADRYYRCLVTASCGSTYSSTAHVTVVPDPAITVQPAPVTICSGTTTELTVTATGGTPSLNYQWESSPNGTNGWVNVGSNSLSYTTASLTQTTYYRVTVTATGSGCNSITSNVVAVSVPRITTQPVSSIICTGGSVNALTITADAGSATLAYQWQSATALAGPYANVTGGSGANTTSYITDVLTATTYFRCVVTVTSPVCADLISNSATITVVADPAITVQPVGTTICNGGNNTLSVTATGGTPILLYQWQYSTVGATGPWTNAGTVSTQATGALSATRWYRVNISAAGTGCDPIVSDVVEIAVVSDPTINIPPVGATICSGGTHSMSVTATGNVPPGTLNYQWQISTTGTGGWSTVGTNSNAYTTAVLAATRYYRVIITQTASGCSTTSANAQVTVVADPNVTTQPVGASICTGGTHTMSVVAAGGTPSLTYQWQISTAGAGGPWSDISGETATSYTTAVLVATTWYRVVVSASGVDCASATSNVATVTVVADPTINTQPAGTTICSGGTHSLSVAASGGTPSLNYQWQSSTTGGAPWTNVGTNSSSYTTAALAVTTYYQVLVSATGNDCNTTTSTTAEVTVVLDPTISVQPVGATICNGGTHSMSVTATGNVPPGTLNYQWEISTTGGAPWTAIGTNSDSYTTDVLAATRYYRVIITQTASGCSTTSATAQVTVVADPAITTQPVGASICFGGNHSMTVAASGGTPSLDYQWQVSTAGAGGPWSDLVGETGTGYTTPAIFATTWYRVVVSATGVGCATVTSNVAAVVVEGDPQITLQPVGAEICNGGNHSMSIAATGGTPTLEYQWESSTVGSTGPWSVITGATATSYSTPALAVTTWYHVIVTAPGSDCNTTISNAVEVTVVPDPAISVQPADITICSGTTTVLSVTAINGTPSLDYLWETSANGTNGWSTVGGNSNAYTTASLTQTTYYRVSVSATGNGCNTVTSNVVVVSVPRILTQPVGASICSGGSHDMSVLVESGSATLTYQWQFSDFDCNSGWSPIGGATTNTYTASILPPVGTRYYRCVVSVASPACADIITNCVAVVVVPDPAITLQPLGTTICEGSTHTMVVAASGGTPALDYQWQSASALAGPYSNVIGGSGANSAIYTTPALSATTYYQVIVSATGSGCGTVVSTPVSVVVNPTPTANAGANAAICSNETYTLSGSTATNYTSLLWTTSGTGTFNNPTAIHPIYSPSGADISSGSVNLTLTAFANAPCVNGVDQMTLTISSQPTANAGSDATVCQGTAYTVSGASATNYSTILWTAPGPGVLTNAGTITPTYTPTAGQTGTVTLTLTANPNGSCTAATDQMVITINAAPTTAIAGIDQSFCKSTTSTNMTANTPTSGSGVWLQLSGPNTALIANTSNPGTLISNLVPGIYIFQWTISNGVCTPSSDQVQITVLNCGPVAIDDDFTTPEDTQLNGNILANDSDPDGDPIFVTQFIISGTPYPAGSTVNMPGIGVIIVYSNGLFTFTPELDYTGVVPTIPYTISDGTSTATADLDITVTPENDPPVAVDEIVTTPEDTPVSGNVLANDSDPDGDAITVTQFVIAGDVTVYNPGDLATITGVGTLIINSDGTFTFTPDAGYNGTVPVATYTISDGSLTDIATLSIFVNPVNDPPVAADNNVSTPEDTFVSGNLLTNDSDPDGDPIVVTQFVVDGTTYPAGATVNIPGTGVITIYSNGLFEFTPALDYTGTVPAIPYTISDGNGGTATADLNITVNGVNDAPVAVNDSNTTQEDTPVSGDVLTNDSDPEGDPLVVTQFVVDGDVTVYLPGDLATIAGVGTIEIGTDGTYTFTPALNYNGVVPTVTYTISDGNGGTDTADLDIAVTPVNDPPVALDDAFATNEDTPVSGTVTTNDSDVDGNLNPSSYSIITGPTDGSLLLNPNGTFTYTPDPDFSGTDTFVYEVCDLGLPVYCDQATVTITINSENDAPVAVNDVNTTPEDTPVSGNVLTNDSDPDGDALVVTQFLVDGDVTVYLPGDVATIAGVGTIVINSNGGYTFTPDPDYNGNIPTVTYTISDGNGGTDTADLNITVTPVNDPPVALDDAFATNEDTPVSGTLTVNDSDVDGNLNPSSYSVITGPANGTLMLNPNGTFTYTPDPDFTGTDTFVYEVCDLGLPVYCDQATVTITVNGVNDAPVAVNDVNSTPEDTPVSGNVLTNDSDPEGDPLVVTQFMVDGDVTVYLPGDVATIAGVGTIVIETNGDYTFTPVLNYTGTVPTITYTISDGNGGTDTADLDITVTPVNDPPVALDDAFTTNEDTPVSGTVTVNDSDVDGNLNPNGFALVTGPANGTISFSNNGAFTYTPSAGYLGSDSFVYSVCDLGMPIYCDQATVTITIDPVNDNPVAVNDVNTTPEDTPVSGNVLTNDSDPDGDPLAVTQFVVDGDVTVYLPGDVATIAGVGTIVIETDGTYTFTPVPEL